MEPEGITPESPKAEGDKAEQGQAKRPHPQQTLFGVAVPQQKQKIKLVPESKDQELENKKRSSGSSKKSSN